MGADRLPKKVEDGQTLTDLIWQPFTDLYLCLSDEPLRRVANQADAAAAATRRVESAAPGPTKKTEAANPPQVCSFSFVPSPSHHVLVCLFGLAGSLLRRGSVFETCKGLSVVYGCAGWRRALERDGGRPSP